MTARISDEEKLEAAQEVKRELLLSDPNLKPQEAERRSLAAVGLPTGEKPKGPIPKGGRPRAAARATKGQARKVITSSGARKTIFGIMALTIVVGIIQDVRSGRAVTTDVIPRRLIGTLLASFILMVLAGPAPRVARGLSFLVAFTVLAFNQEVIGAIASRASQEGQPRAIGTVPIDEPPRIDEQGRIFDPGSFQAIGRLN